jgi:hypothetical protein
MAIDSKGVITWTPSEAQGPSTNLIVIKVSDNGSPSLSATNSFTVIVGESNSAPVLSAVADQSVDEGSQLSLQIAATDSDLPAQNLTFSLDSGSPDGAALSTSGKFTWTPTESQGPSTNVITVRVSDGATNASQTFKIVVNEVNTTPTLATITTQTVCLGQELTFKVVATDTDIPSQKLTFTLGSAPSGATIDPATGHFSWTPSSVGTNLVRVSVADDGSPVRSASQDFQIIVLNSLSLSLKSPAFTSSQGFGMSLIGSPRSLWQIQVSDNLVDWTPVTTNTLDSQGIWNFTDTTATNASKQFYRAIQLP